MSTLDLLCKRKSIRSYTGEGISEEDLKKIIKAANSSPVGMKRYDNLHLTIVKNKELLDAIDRKAAAFFGDLSRHPLYGAPILIIVSAKEIESGRENSSYSNAAIVVHNMAIEATELDIGACHIWGAIAAIKDDDEILKKLALPPHFIPCSAIALGKSNEKYTDREIPDRISINEID